MTSGERPDDSAFEIRIKVFVKAPFVPNLAVRDVIENK